MQDREIEMVEIDGSWQVRAAATPRQNKSRYLLWLAVFAPVWMALMIALGVGYLDESYRSDMETIAIFSGFLAYAYAITNFVSGLQSKDDDRGPNPRAMSQWE